MKLNSFKIFVVLVLMISGTVQAQANDVEVKGSPKHKNFFTLKTNKDLVGAKVEVFYSNGELLTSQKLLKKKMIIDFADARFGTYTIRLTKGDSAKEYQFTKK